MRLEIIDVSEYDPKRIPSKTWRECIKKIWEVDPLLYPKFSGKLKAQKKSCQKSCRISIYSAKIKTDLKRDFLSVMKSGGVGGPSGTIASLIDKAFGSYDKFAEQFKDAGVTQFGSGWAWLVLKDDSIEITKTANTDTPLAHELKPLLTVDVWEHAYYLYYQNRRPDYLSAFIKHLIKWDFVNSLLD